MRNAWIVAISVAVMWTACDNVGPGYGISTGALTAVDAELLAFVNDQHNTDRVVLDVDCAIRSDSAR